MDLGQPPTSSGPCHHRERRGARVPVSVTGQELCTCGWLHAGALVHTPALLCLYNRAPSVPLLQGRGPPRSPVWFLPSLSGTQQSWLVAPALPLPGSCLRPAVWTLFSQPLASAQPLPEPSPPAEDGSVTTWPQVAPAWRTPSSLRAPVGEGTQRKPPSGPGGGKAPGREAGVVKQEDSWVPRREGGS